MDEFLNTEFYKSHPELFNSFFYLTNKRKSQHQFYINSTRFPSPIPKQYLPSNSKTLERKRLLLEEECKTLQSPLHIDTMKKYCNHYIRSIEEHIEIADNLEEIIKEVIESGKTFHERYKELKEFKIVRRLSSEEKKEKQICYYLKNYNTM